MDPPPKLIFVSLCSETLLAAANTFRTICEQDMSELSVLVADRVAALCCNLAGRQKRRIVGLVTVSHPIFLL